MAKIPKVDFYPGDFLVGCTDLTMEERGQYITLLCVQHQKGRLSPKMIQLSLGISVKKIKKDVITKFIVDAEGLYYNERMEYEMNKYAKFSETQADHARKGWEKRRKKPTFSDATASATAMPTNMPGGCLSIDNDNDSSFSSSSSKESEGILLTTFEDFWNVYDVNQDRIKCEVEWMHMTEEERRSCLAVVSAYVASTPDKAFRRNPFKYLKTKSWKNEIIVKNETGKRNNGAKPEELANLIARKYGTDSRQPK